ncbi:nucleotidyltransferase family protein [Stutzerimonas balearica]|uniref:nucleotidyltransferase family protein n=1 Tax=Stutzerimonas balearica TaxID=74829 RepID=UPI0035E3D1CE
MENTISQLIKVAENEPTIKRMWIFGSRYKGTNHPESDLDLAVELEWVKGQQLGFCEDALSLWVAATPRFANKLKNCCYWKLDLQQYSGIRETPRIHSYLQEASLLIYEKA